MLSYVPPTNEEKAMVKLNISIKELKRLKDNGLLKHKGSLICNRSIDEYLKGGSGYKEALSTAITSAINAELINRFELIQKREAAEHQLKELYALGFIDLLFPDKNSKKRHKLFFERKIDKIQEAKLSPLTTEYIQEQIKEANSIIDEYVIDGNIDYGEANNKIQVILKEIKKLGLVAPAQKEIKRKVELVKKEIKALGLSENHEKIVYDETAYQFRKYAYRNCKEVELAKEMRKLEESIFYYNRQLFSFTKDSLEKKVQFESFREKEFQKIKQIEVDNADIVERIYLEKKKLKYEEKISELNRQSESLQDTRNKGYSDFFKEYKNDTTAKNTIISMQQVHNVVNQVRTAFNKKAFETEVETINELQNQISWNFNTI
jgi:hypothetical protein